MARIALIRFNPDWSSDDMTSDYDVLTNDGDPENDDDWQNEGSFASQESAIDWCDDHGYSYTIAENKLTEYRKTGINQPQTFLRTLMAGRLADASVMFEQIMDARTTRAMIREQKHLTEDRLLTDVGEIFVSQTPDGEWEVGYNYDEPDPENPYGSSKIFDTFPTKDEAVAFAHELAADAGGAQFYVDESRHSKNNRGRHLHESDDDDSKSKLCAFCGEPDAKGVRIREITNNRGKTYKAPVCAECWDDREKEIQNESRGRLIVRSESRGLKEDSYIDGKVTKKCPTCNGSGWMKNGTNALGDKQEKECTTCNGRGRLIVRSESRGLKEDAIPAGTTCECADPLCPACHGSHEKLKTIPATMELHRIDMGGDAIYFCEGCGEDALESGSFSFFSDEDNVDNDMMESKRHLKESTSTAKEVQDTFDKFLIQAINGGADDSIPNAERDPSQSYERQWAMRQTEKALGIRGIKINNEGSVFAFMNEDAKLTLFRFWWSDGSYTEVSAETEGKARLKLPVNVGDNYIVKVERLGSCQ